MRAKYRNVKVILSHGGGTLPVLAFRIATCASLLGCTKSVEEIIEEFKSFYYDTALVSPIPLKALLDFADHDKIIFGSDLPYFMVNGVVMISNLVEEYLKKNGLKELSGKINQENATALFKSAGLKSKL